MLKLFYPFGGLTRLLVKLCLKKYKVREISCKLGSYKKSIIYIELEGFFTIQTDVVVV